MRPARDRLSLLLLLVAAWVGAGCAKDAAPPPMMSGGAAAAAPAMELVVGEPVAPPISRPPPPDRHAPNVVVAPAPEADTETETETDALPKTWTGPIVPGLSFADAMRKARGARDAYSRLAVPAPSASEAGLKAWFSQAQSLVDQASRMYAASFHAPGAAREGRIDAISEAAELDMTIARNLDEAGLGALPAAWRSDPAVASTFEDIAVGPTRRWRDEARVLARQCIETARETGVATDAARRCALLRTGAPMKVAKRAADAGAPCACAPSDPLCSASLGG